MSDVVSGPAAPAAKRPAKMTERWRMATADLRPLPSIVIIGAQRSGTTSLHSWLCSHPKVAPFLSKEVHYFDGAYERGERWYRSKFPISLGGQVHVDASPYMLFHPLAAERAGRDLPDSTRFVALLREPAERALSHHHLEIRKGHETETFARAPSSSRRAASKARKTRSGEVKVVAHIVGSPIAPGVATLISCVVGSMPWDATGSSWLTASDCSTNQTSPATSCTSST